MLRISTLNNLTECERKFKECENEITKQYQYAQRELLQSKGKGEDDI